MKLLVAALLLVTLPATARAREGVRWSAKHGVGLATFEQCSVYFGPAAGTSRADAEVLVRRWFTADFYRQVWCSTHGVVVSLKRSRDGTPYAIIPPAISDEVIADQELQRGLRDVAYDLAAAFGRDFVFLVRDPDVRDKTALVIRAQYAR